MTVIAASQGQSQEAKAFVARRKAGERAAAEARAAQAARALEARADLEARLGESPVLLMIGILFTVVILVAGFWWYLDTAACDPMISSHAYSAACRGPGG